LEKELGLRAKTVFNPDGGGPYIPCIYHKPTRQFDVLVHRDPAQTEMKLGDKVVRSVFEITGKGSSAHSSRPWEGISAYSLLLEGRERVVDALRSTSGVHQVTIPMLEAGKKANQVPEEGWLAMQVAHDESLGRAQLEEIIRTSAKPLKLHEGGVESRGGRLDSLTPVFESEPSALDDLILHLRGIENLRTWATRESTMETSVNIGRVTGDARDASASLDIRCSAVEDINSLVKQMEALNPGSRIEVRKVGDALVVDTDRPAFQEFMKVLDFYSPDLIPFGYDGSTVEATGSSDARHFMGQGSTVVMIKAAGSEFHAENEYVLLSSLVMLKEVLERYLAVHSRLMVEEDREKEIEKMSRVQELCDVRVIPAASGELAEYFRSRESVFDEELGHLCYGEGGYDASSSVDNSRILVASSDDGELIGGLRLVDRQKEEFDKVSAYDLPRLAKRLEMRSGDLESSVFLVDRAFVTKEWRRRGVFGLLIDLAEIESARLLIDRGLGDEPVPILITAITPTNYPSVRAFETAGFKPYTMYSDHDEGTTRHSYFKRVNFN